MNVEDLWPGRRCRLVWTGERGVPKDLNGALCEVETVGPKRVRVAVLDGRDGLPARWVDPGQLAEPFANQERRQQREWVGKDGE